MKTLEQLINASSDPSYYRHALKALDAGDEARLQELATHLERAGAAQPLAWAHSEVTENIAQTARFFALRDLCAGARSVQEVLDGCDADDAAGLFDELLRAGADRASLERLVLAIAKSTVWHCLTVIDEGGDSPSTRPWDGRSQRQMNRASSLDGSWGACTRMPKAKSSWVSSRGDCLPSGAALRALFRKERASCA